MKNARILNCSKLYQVNKNNGELIQLLSPEIGESNQELFYKKSGNQTKFSLELKNKGIGRLQKENYQDLDDCLEQCRVEVESIIKNPNNIKKTRLDLDLAKIIHKNLPLSKRAICNYEFWRYITLFHFIELVKWRWEKDPQKPSNWNSNAGTISSRAMGITLNKKKYEENKVIEYASRNQRIDVYRYWWIGNRLYDKTKGYYYLEKISEKYKSEDAAIQQFLLELEGSKLLSLDDRISKIFAKEILLSNTRYSEKELENCFRRYNAYSNRLFMQANEDLIRKEICSPQERI